MEETLTNCLVRVREDLSQLKKVREYLEENTETEEQCSITWRTIEAFNSILSVCSSQNSPETNALDTLLDSFYYLARNNNDSSVWDDFGFELGIICVKVLSAIERTDIFEVLFCKLLTIISIICEHNSSVWKTTARQILNVLINKKFSLGNFEVVLKICISILRNIDSYILSDFSLQNLHLLKTLSLFVQKMGDFEIQSDIMELIFLHLSNDVKLMTDFFSPLEKKLFQSLQFVDFAGDCRLYLNSVNKSRREFDRKVYSICCLVLYLGGCFVEPPVNKNSIWVDANKDSERISIKCSNDESDRNQVICIQFSDILHIQFENDKTEGNRCLTIQTKSLVGLHKDIKNDNICLVVENIEGVYEFVHFLETAISENKKKKKCNVKISKTMDSLIIDRNTSKKIVQDNAITSSEKPSIDCILPDVLSMFERANLSTTKSDMQFKTLQSSKISTNEKKTPFLRKSQEIKLVSQELSPNSFAESLNKHIGLNSPELRRTYEDSAETIEFLQRSVNTPGKTHKLFRNSDKIFNILEAKQSKTFNFLFEENKENNPPVEKTQKRINQSNQNHINQLINQEPQISKLIVDPPSTRVLRSRKNLEKKLSNSQSEDYFQKISSVMKKKKPSLPKLKRNPNEKLKCIKKKDEIYKNKKFPINEKNQQKKIENQIISMKMKLYKEKGIQHKLEREQNRTWKSKNLETEKIVINLKETQKTEVQQEDIQKERTSAEESANLPKETERQSPELNQQQEQNQLNTEPVRKHSKNKSKNQISEFKQDAKPSLLDPNGYAYQRWCKPTTSERSNFWLKKLNAVQKLKTRSDVFDFSEEADSICEVRKNEKKKPKVILSKRKHWTKKETKQTSLREVKEIIKKASPVREKLSPIRQKSVQKEEQSFLPDSHNEAFVPPPEPFAEDLQHPLCISSPESLHEGPAGDDSEYESVTSSEDEELPRQTKKRERSDEESSKTLIKKRPKTTLPKGLISAFRRKLQITEQKDRRYTNEIISAVNKATNHLFNYFQRKDGEKVLSYLKAAEAVSTAFETGIDDLDLQIKRIHKVVGYLKSMSSVSNMTNSLEAHFSIVRDAFKNLKGKKDSLKAVDKITDRLNNLIKTEIDRSIRDEWTMKRNKLMKCTSVFENFSDI